ncbi:helix-turn-helix transcriptional regulator [Streptomyces sp. NPDC005970]|uniref:helix-turn-helix transcriptional regulator n=1 Tax=Streptomyces sp. NPDC005970 TaxID=3156723 RepID=UPI0033DB9B03
MYQCAGHSWSVPELAAVSGLSRAALARIFHQALGQTPMQYLTDWRMALARGHLRTGELGVASIARIVGHNSRPTPSQPHSAATTANHPALGDNQSRRATGGRPPGTMQEIEAGLNPRDRGSSPCS